MTKNGSKSPIMSLSAAERGLEDLLDDPTVRAALKSRQGVADVVVPAQPAQGLDTSDLLLEPLGDAGADSDGWDEDDDDTVADDPFAVDHPGHPPITDDVWSDTTRAYDDGGDEPFLAPAPSKTTPYEAHSPAVVAVLAETRLEFALEVAKKEGADAMRERLVEFDVATGRFSEVDADGVPIITLTEQVRDDEPTEMPGDSVPLGAPIDAAPAPVPPRPSKRITPAPAREIDLDLFGPNSTHAPSNELKPRSPFPAAVPAAPIVGDTSSAEPLPIPGAGPATQPQVRAMDEGGLAPLEHPVISYFREKLAWLLSHFSKLRKQKHK